MAYGIIMLIEINGFNHNRLAFPLLDVIAGLIEGKSGDMVSTTAGKVVCHFRNFADAADVAFRIQQDDRAYGVNGAPQTRISLHDIATIKESNGLAPELKMSVKALSFADFGEVVVSASAAAMKPGAYELRLIPESAEGNVRFFELLKPAAVSSSEECTRALHTPEAGGALERWVQLTIGGIRGGRKLSVGNRNKIVTFGRSESNDIAVESEMVSRYHGYIEYRDRKIHIVDKSKNGIFMFPHYGKSYRICHESKVLPAQGYFCLGNSLAGNSSQAIHFTTVIDNNH